MENDGEQKNHPPSQRKLKKAREKGEVAVSRELVSAAVFMGGIAALFFCAPRLFAGLLELVSLSFSEGVSAEFLRGRFFSLLLPVLVPVFFMALAASAAQTGWLFRARMDFSRLNPVKGLKNIFSRKRLVDLLLSALKFLAMVFCGWQAGVFFWKNNFRADAGLTGVTANAVGLLAAVLVTVAAVGLLFGGQDFLLQRFRHLKRMRMSRRELMEELKEQEGHPLVRSERRRAHRQLCQAVGLAAMNRARLVVVNPTHIAVALAYREGQDQAPWVVVSGWGEKALAVRNEAHRQKVPVVEQVELARGLIVLEWGEEIPDELYQATADLILALERAGRPDGSGPKSGQMA